MNRPTTSTAIPTRALKFEALANISASFELFCLASGMEALGEMMDHDARAICGPRHARGHDRRAHRWGKTRGKIGFHGGKVEIERPRLRSFEGKEQALPSWEAAVAEDWLGKWAMNQMLINVSTRKFARSVRLPEGDVPAPIGSGLSKSAASRRFVALSAARMKEWVASDLSGLDLLRCVSLLLCRFSVVAPGKVQGGRMM
jgi:putative transposase